MRKNCLLELALLLNKYIKLIQGWGLHETLCSTLCSEELKIYSYHERHIRLINYYFLHLLKGIGKLEAQRFEKNQFKLFYHIKKLFRKYFLKSRRFYCKHCWNPVEVFTRLRRIYNNYRNRRIIYKYGSIGKEINCFWDIAFLGRNTGLRHKNFSDADASGIYEVKRFDKTYEVIIDWYGIPSEESFEYCINLEGHKLGE